METRLRMLMVLSGLPEPVVNHKIRWPDGQVRFRFDLSYPDAGLVVEYDGRQHADSTTQWGSDLGRREWLDGNDWRIVVVIATDLHRTPAATLQRIRAAMRQRGMAVPPVDEQWRRHFTSLPGPARAGVQPRGRVTWRWMRPDGIDATADGGAGLVQAADLRLFGGSGF